jgi:hypothetical protein
MEQRVWLAQVLCPQRHAVIAGAAEIDNLDEVASIIVKPLLEKLKFLMNEGNINPWCNICGAKHDTWKVDAGQTRFHTLGEAEPMLRHLEQENHLAHRILGGHPGPGKVN